MHRFVKTITAVVLGAASVWPVAASAQSVEAGTQLEQVRGAFATAGYQVEAPLSWEWTQPPVSTFRVHDTARNRVLLVLVYPNSGAAVTARLQAEANDQLRQAGRPVTSGGEGPHLVNGYGPSAWQGNVALVQTTEGELTRAFRAQNDRDNTMDSAPMAELPPTNVAVDLDFVQALVTSVANL